MFATGDFQTPPPPRPPLQDNRAVGLLVLLVCILLCLILSVGFDTVVFIPLNATHAITQTWEALHPTTPTTTRSPFQPRRTSTPTFNPFDQQAQIPVADPGIP